VEFVSHFGLQAAFPQVLSSLLAAGEIESAVKFSLGTSQDCIEAQTITLKHVASTELLPVRLAFQANADAIGTRKLPPIDERKRGTSSASDDHLGVARVDEACRPGGTAALLAVNFNPTKKATGPIEKHMWTLENSTPLKMSDLQCSIVVVDSPEALCKAETALSPLLEQAALAISARKNQYRQAPTNGSNRQQLIVTSVDERAHCREQDQEQHQIQEPLEIEWSSPEEFGYPLLGLDTESPPVKTKGASSRVSLLQVFTSSLPTVALFCQFRPLCHGSELQPMFSLGVWDTAQLLV
jgi:hypothetical protein